MNSISLPHTHVMQKQLHYTYPSRQSAIVIPENWERSDPGFTSDEVISAYEIGKETGKNVQQHLSQKMLYEQFTANVALATKIAEEYSTFFTDLRTEPHIRLRINSFSSFDLAFVLSEAFYNSKYLEAAYDAAYDLEQSHASDMFSIFIYLFPKTKGFDISKMEADGFNIFYEPKIKKPTHSSCSAQ
ncbi:hypothetical protein [Chitinophaga sp. CF418]|uniref:hypothetical protein n=1 Tax=Chitinophaga sp. CF418 TaxID=1855287 RepID=UPI000912F5C3|nr:hypothetical protein [Chitinophaga sp. CF418]SHN11380.1 hypothetical protein SAMN05216311_105240 [Chitinophaga sp. CF418]